MVRSLQLHQSHMQLVGATCHYAARASLQARPFIGDAAHKHAQSVHKAANRAKHSWGSSTLNLDALIPSQGMSEALVNEDTIPTLLGPLPSGLPLQKINSEASSWGATHHDCKQASAHSEGASVQTDEQPADVHPEGSFEGLQAWAEKEVSRQLQSALEEINTRWTMRLHSLQQEVHALRHRCVPDLGPDGSVFETSLRAFEHTKNIGPCPAKGVKETGVQCELLPPEGPKNQTASSSEPQYVRIAGSASAGEEGAGVHTRQPAKHHLFVGMTVVFQGLKKRPALNGAFGHLCGWDAGTQRWKVELPGDEVPILVKAENLRGNG
eukprot:CAMPEP_0178411738 /NCGR_PEP_ID=MMETSP0689_2-20121128/21648_1 /TAXON_ID=160604 /ORGANISM="Amphidinium massartii, Strain CS-259" /LENGTH=323 /DNA_ID=CAMNT_0020032951 /DNA_START=249 /DNA_END=1220 /DNA_ORIENTATION=+